MREIAGNALGIPIQGVHALRYAQLLCGMTVDVIVILPEKKVIDEEGDVVAPQALDTTPSENDKMSLQNDPFLLPYPIR